MNSSMLSFEQLIHEYTQSTPMLLIVPQCVLWSLGTALLIVGSMIRLGFLARSKANSVRAQADEVAALAPLIGILGTVLGAAALLPAIGEGDFSQISRPLGMALLSTAVGAATAVIAVLAHYVTPRPERQDLKCDQ